MTAAGTAVRGGQTASAEGVASEVVRAFAAEKAGAEDDGVEDGEDDDAALEEEERADDLKREKPNTMTVVSDRAMRVSERAGGLPR